MLSDKFYEKVKGRPRAKAATSKPSESFGNIVQKLKGRLKAKAVTQEEKSTNFLSRIKQRLKERQQTEAKKTTSRSTEASPPGYKKGGSVKKRSKSLCKKRS